MTDTSTALNRVKAAAYAVREATDLLHRQIREAHEAGTPVTRIAEAAGVARQTVYNILGRTTNEGADR